jgi:hypothetical protein
MRTKALILSAMIGVAGIVSSQAQNVYSVNVVGYINLTLTGEFSLIANQLDNGAGNYVTNVLDALPNQSVVYKFNGSTYDTLTHIVLPTSSFWTPAGNTAMTLAPGEGVFVKKPAAVPEINLTFVGEVMQGSLTNPVVANFEIYSAMVPQEGGIQTVHEYVPSNFDVVYKFNGVSYDQSTWLTALSRWNPPGEPQLGVGEAFFMKATAQDWVRDFTVQ